jgi:signal transduction histidine kinase
VRLGTIRHVRWLLAVGVLPLGLVAERVGFPAAAAGRAALDLAVGWLVVGCGLVVWARRPDSRTGSLLVCTGYAWFLGNFAALPPRDVAALADRVSFLFWGFLVHALLTYPTGRMGDRLERVAIPVAYALSLWPALWRTDLGPIVLALALAVSLVVDRRFHSRQDRRRRLPALVAGLMVAVVTAASQAVSLLTAGGGAVDSGALVTVAVGIAALVLAAGMLGWWGRASNVTDLVVELGESPGGALAEALARALDDPTLEVGFWNPGADAYLASDGRSIAEPAASEGRATTHVDHDGRPVALLVHDAALMTDPQLRDAIASATALAASNARLRAEVSAQVAEVQASRRRLVDAQDSERRALEERLQEGSAHRLDDLAAIIHGVPPDAALGLSGAGDRLASAAAEVAQTHADLDELALGLHPRALVEFGLRGALQDLAGRSPVPVEVDLGVGGLDGHLPPDVAATIWFVCSEALANVAKYAAASRVQLSCLESDDVVRLVVADDGRGGADPGRGSGLRGLMDRVAAIGGALTVDSPVGAGTRLAATIPSGGGAEMLETVDGVSV